MTPLELFPPIEPYSVGRLPVDEYHTLYWEQSGNPEGVPVVFLHGGPGSGASPKARRYFDPRFYRIVVFDQRGCGRSTPLEEVRNNTPDLLVQDIDTLRRHLGVPRWHVFGGSWGSTLALAYAQAHPSSCLSLILRGIFLMRPWEIEWFVKGVEVVFPDVVEMLTDYLPTEEHHDVLGAFYGRLNSADSQERLEAATVWSRYEASFSTLLPNPGFVTACEDPVMALGRSRMETHYFKYNLFQPHDRLLRDIPLIRHIPAVIVQGRYDMVCPFKSAYELHRAWPEAEFVIVPDAGHSTEETGIFRSLLAATEKFKSISLTK